MLPVRPGWIRRPILAGIVIRRRRHSIERWDASPEEVRIPQRARVGFQMCDTFGGHEDFDAAEILCRLPLSITRLLVWHGYDDLGKG